jgi:two-component system OmpR family sensor kinase
VVDGDPVRLAQIIGNLLDNARTASGPSGSVAVDLAPAGGWWRVDVTDDGPGVPQGDRERIFDRLARLDGSRTRDRGGFGLGLSIARALARAHGGDLVCTAPDGGRGAVFVLTLPVA